jgi:hypothetical protein
MVERHTVMEIDGWRVLVQPGIKSPHDFKVLYQQESSRIRTPKHIHLIIDLIIKREHSRDLTRSLIRHMLSVLTRLRASVSYPPQLQVFRREDAEEYRALDAFGEYPVAFLLVVFELIMIQEKTNYPSGVMNRHLFERFLNDADIFSVVSAATFR